MSWPSQELRCTGYVDTVPLASPEWSAHPVSIASHQYKLVSSHNMLTHLAVTAQREDVSPLTKHLSDPVLERPRIRNELILKVEDSDFAYISAIVTATRLGNILSDSS